MAKEKRILIYFISFLLGFFLIMFIGISGVFAATYDTGNVTWYYREIANESVLLSTEKNINTPLNIVNGEYMNGFRTRIEHTFSKNLQYIVTYKLKMLYYETLDDLFRQDTISRLTEYSWVDSDFRLLNTNVNQSKYLCEADICEREFTISQQILTLNSTSAIRFGVYTTLDRSIGFYSPPYASVNMTLSNIITIEDNSSSAIIDQNNQIIDGQNGINNNIQNSTNTITGSITDTENNITNSITDTENNINQNIDDMEQSIVDSNKETQDVIKDQFNSCRDSNNLFNATLINSTSGIIVNKDGSKITIPKVSSGNGFTDTHTKLSVLAPELKVGDVVYLNFNTNSSYNKFIYLVTPQLVWYDGTSITITQEMLNSKVGFYGNRFTNGEDYQVIISDLIMSYKNTSFEPYGEICNNKIDDTNNKLDGIQGALTDSSAPNTSGLENSAGWLPAGPLDSILNLPLTMLNSLTNSLGKTCAPLNLTLPYVNKNIQIPCLSTIFAQITGVNGLWTWVGTIASVLILYNYLLNLYAWVDRVLTLRAEFDEAMGADMANWGRL